MAGLKKHRFRKSLNAGKPYQFYHSNRIVVFFSVTPYIPIVRIYAKVAIILEYHQEPQEPLGAGDDFSGNLGEAMSEEQVLVGV